MATSEKLISPRMARSSDDRVITEKNLQPSIYCTCAYTSILTPLYCIPLAKKFHLFQVPFLKYESNSSLVSRKHKSSANNVYGIGF